MRNLSLLPLPIVLFASPALASDQKGDEPVQTAAIDAPIDVRVVLSINGALVLGLGLLPGGLMALCDQAILSLWH